MSFLQAAALREERHAAQQRREAAMHAQGGYSLDAIQPVLKATHATKYWFPSIGSRVYRWFNLHKLTHLNGQYVVYLYIPNLYTFLNNKHGHLCVSRIPFGLRHVDFQPIPSPGPRRRSAEVRCEMSFAVRRAYACPICSESFAKWSICQNHVNSMASWH